MVATCAGTVDACVVAVVAECVLVSSNDTRIFPVYLPKGTTPVSLWTQSKHAGHRCGYDWHELSSACDEGEVAAIPPILPHAAGLASATMLAHWFPNKAISHCPGTWYCAVKRLAHAVCRWAVPQ